MNLLNEARASIALDGETQYMPRIIGIDPGGSGGMACIVPSGPVLITKLDMTERDIAEWLRSMDDEEPAFAYIEKVGANRGPGNRAQGASSMFTFGQSYGFLRGCLVALQIPFEEVQPRKWQATFSLLRTDKNESTTDKKNRHKAKAQQLWPHIKVTHHISDALLIAEHGRRLRTGATP